MCKMAPWYSSLGPHYPGSKYHSSLQAAKVVLWLAVISPPACLCHTLKHPWSLIKMARKWVHSTIPSETQQIPWQKNLTIQRYSYLWKISMFIKLGLERGRISSSSIKIVGQMITFGVYFMPLHFSRSKLWATTFLWENNSKSKIHCQCFIDHKMWKYPLVEKTLSCDAWYSSC